MKYLFTYHFSWSMYNVTVKEGDKSDQNLKPISLSCSHFVGMCVLSHSVVSDSATPWTVAHQAPLVHGDSPGKNTGLGCHALLQGLFPTQGSNPGLLHCRWIIFCLSHQGSPRILEGSLSPLQGIFLAQESNQGFLHGRQILYQLSYQGNPLLF